MKRVIGIPVNLHISMGILSRTPRAILVKIPIEMCQFTRIPMTRFKVSFMLQTFFSEKCNERHKALVISNKLSALLLNDLFNDFMQTRNVIILVIL